MHCNQHRHNCQDVVVNRNGERLGVIKVQKSFPKQIKRATRTLRPIKISREERDEKLFTKFLAVIVAGYILFIVLIPLL